MALVYRAADSVDSYVGVTAGSLFLRQREHRKDALRQSPRTRFEKVLKERGFPSFRWAVLWSGEPSKARGMEQYFIKVLAPTLNDNTGGAGLGRIRHTRATLLPVVPILNEHWRSIKGYEGIYEISDHGRVKSLRRTVYNPLLGIMERPSGLLRTPAIRGRPRVTLCRDGKERHVKVQALVAEAFIGPRPPGFGVLHHDDDKLNNKHANLYYGTAKENANDRSLNGRTIKGEHHHMAIITEAEAKEVIRLHHNGVRQCDIVRKLGITKQAVSHIRQGRSWSHLERP